MSNIGRGDKAMTFGTTLLRKEVPALNQKKLVVMENEFVDYSTALALKELGFDEPCVATFHDNSGGEIEFTFGMFHHPKKNSEANTVSGTFIGKNGCYAPLYQQAFRWFREKYDFVGTILGDGFNGELKGYYYSITEEGWINYYESIDDSKWYNTYEEAELACLRKLIEIVKENL